MFEIIITGTNKLNSYDELIKVFLQPSEYRLLQEGKDQEVQDDPKDLPVRLEYHEEGDLYAVARRIYADLSEATGKFPKWGVLTGIRPVKLAYELTYGSKRPEAARIAEDIRRTASAQGAASEEVRTSSDPDPAADTALVMDRHYLLHPRKISLVTEILEYQRETAGDPPDRSLSVYIGIPFCPTRCLYCSFTSNQVPEEEITGYLKALEKEIEFASAEAEKDGFRIESVYMGGGTPTTLNALQLDRLLGIIRDRFGLDHQPLREFTVEAGRPDTFTAQKLEVLRRHGVERISINPQTMHQDTLDRIGRRHTPEQTREAFRMAGEAGFDCINTDLIAGLPGEDFPAFAQSLEEIMDLGADNITLHTLAVKRASRLREMDDSFHYRNEQLREEMLTFAEKKLRQAGYRPYYLYRQKHTSGNTENIGYCREDKVSIYNIRIMEERKSILALGAGGISKIWFPEENRLERVANVSNYEIYIDRIDEMIRRKQDRFFGQGK